MRLLGIVGLPFVVVQPHDMDPQVRRLWRAVLERRVPVADSRDFVSLEPDWNAPESQAYLYRGER